MLLSKKGDHFAICYNKGIGVLILLKCSGVASGHACHADMTISF